MQSSQQPQTVGLLVSSVQHHRRKQHDLHGAGAAGWQAANGQLPAQQHTQACLLEHNPYAIRIWSKNSLQAGLGEQPHCPTLCSPVCPGCGEMVTRMRHCSC